MKIEKNKVVLMNYTLRNEDGDVLDTSDGREPLAFIQGIGNIIPGLEEVLEGREAGGEKINAVIAPQDAYGEPREDMVQTAPIEEFSELPDLEVGKAFQFQTPQGIGQATITELTETEVTFDMNHPLAGKTLHFEVDITEVRDATEEELEHGHVHGPGGHQH